MKINHAKFWSQQLASLARTSIGLFVALPLLAGPENPVASGTNMTEIQQLRAQLAEQSRRIDRLYDALGPQLAEMGERAVALKKQTTEDAALAMKEVLRSKDDVLTDKLIIIPNTPLLAAAKSDRTVKMLSRHEKAGGTTLAGLDGVALCLAGSADGTKLFAGTQKGSIFVCLDHGTNFQKIFDWDGWPLTALAVSPDGTRLVCVCNGKYDADRKWTKPDESLLAIEVAGGKKLWSGKAGRGDFEAVSFAGGGKTLAVVQDGFVALLDAETGRTVRKLA